MDDEGEGACFQGGRLWDRNAWGKAMSGLPSEICTVDAVLACVVAVGGTHLHRETYPSPPAGFQRAQWNNPLLQAWA